MPKPLQTPQPSTASLPETAPAAVSWRVRLRNPRLWPKRVWVYLAVLLLLAVMPFWNGPRPRQIALRGSPEAMGQAYGRQCKWSIRLLCHAYLKRFLCRNNAQVLEQRCNAALALEPLVEPRLLRELRATAESAGVVPGLLLLGNSFLDLGYYGGGCRSVVWDDTGPQDWFLHAHNLDWDSVAGMADWGICVVRRTPDDGRHPTVAVALPGMAGVLDVINARGLALSLNLVQFGRPETAREPGFLLMRRIAETCSTYAEARAELLKVSPHTPFLFTLSAAKERLAGVFEPFPDGYRERVLADGRISSANDCWGSNDVPSVVNQTVKAAVLNGPKDMETLMASSGVLLGCNIYSVIWDYGHNRMWLASGRTPAAPRGYREFRLFP